MKSDRWPRVTLVVLIYNGKKWIDLCLRSLLETDYSNLQVIAVDNHSTDDSPSYIEHNFKNILLIRCKKNLGSSAYNLGIQEAIKRNANYVGILNQDIKAERTWLTEMIKVFQVHPDIGILGPIQYDYEGKEIDYIFRSKMLARTSYMEDQKKGHLSEFYEVDWMGGVCMLVKKEVFKKIGGLDPFYFLYDEDLDFSRRAKFRGFRIACVTNSRVLHYHMGAHMSSHMSKPEWLIRLQGRNRLITILKDPYHSFAHNLRHAFIWMNWNELFKESKRKRVLKIKVFLLLCFYLPLIFYKYCWEKTESCYLSS